MALRWQSCLDHDCVLVYICYHVWWQSSKGRIRISKLEQSCKFELPPTKCSLTTGRAQGAFKEYLSTGSLGKFEGFLAAIWQGAFTIVGPEYVSMVAGEVQNPRPVLKTAFKTMYIRFAIFFIGSALCVGIVLPADDPTLDAINSGEAEGAGTGAASPYVIAMANMSIEGLPHVINALLITSIFSAGNTYVYCASRTLHGLALDGHAPRFLRYCTESGVPVYCLAVVMIFPFLSFLQVSSASAVVLTW